MIPVVVEGIPIVGTPERGGDLTVHTRVREAVGDRPLLVARNQTGEGNTQEGHIRGIEENLDPGMGDSHAPLPGTGGNHVPDLGTGDGHVPDPGTGDILIPNPGTGDGHSPNLGMRKDIVHQRKSNRMIP